VPEPDDRAGGDLPATPAADATGVVLATAAMAEDAE
jgi:hypothetical protein